MRARVILFSSSRYDPLRWRAVGYFGFKAATQPNEQKWGAANPNIQPRRGSGDEAPAYRLPENNMPPASLVSYINLRAIEA
jgi:hypothetical protein